MYDFPCCLLVLHPGQDTSVQHILGIRPGIHTYLPLEPYVRFSTRGYEMSYGSTYTDKRCLRHTSHHTNYMFCSTGIQYCVSISIRQIPPNWTSQPFINGNDRWVAVCINMYENICFFGIFVISASCIAWSISSFGLLFLTE